MNTGDLTPGERVRINRGPWGNDHIGLLCEVLPKPDREMYGATWLKPLEDRPGLELFNPRCPFSWATAGLERAA